MADGFNNPVVGGDGSLVRKQIKSPDYVPATTGWQLSKDGTADLNNATLRGELDIFGNDGSYIKLQNVSAGPVVSPVVKMQPGAYSDSFTPVPTYAQVFAQAQTIVGAHSGLLSIRSPAYTFYAHITLGSSSQESATDNSTAEMLAHDTQIGFINTTTSDYGTLNLYGSVSITGKLNVPYFAGTLSNISVPNNVSPPAAITIASAQNNNLGQWTSGSNIVIQQSGTHEVGINLDFTSNATGVRQARINVNGSAYKAWNVPALSGFETTVGGTIKIPGLNVGDVITFGAYQNSGGSLSLTGFNECWVKHELMQ